MAQQKENPMKLLATYVLLLGSLTAYADRLIPATPEELTTTVQAAFANADAEIEAIIAISISDEERTFENTVGAIDSMMARLDAAANMSLFSCCHSWYSRFLPVGR